MGVPWTARRSNQLINTEYSMKGPMLLYLGHLMPRANSLEKTLMLEKIVRRGQQRKRWLDGIINLIDMSLIKLREIVKNREAWCAKFMGSQLVTT